DPQEAPVRRLIHELFGEHRRLKTVAKLLNDRGSRTRSGAVWTDTTIRRHLEDPTAKGMRRANWTSKWGTNGKSRGKKPEKEWIWNPVEPIVTEGLWDQCNAILQERKSGRRPAKRATQLFGGLVWCHCGDKMYVPTG